MFNYWIGFVGVFCLLWVLRIPITFGLCLLGLGISNRTDWREGENFFAKEANYCFYYHPEWFPKHTFTKKELEEWRRGVADANNLEDDYP